MDTQQIQVRYDKLATDTCCLSCGNAIGYADPKPGEICVDLGSGRGTDVLRMAETVGPEGFVFGVDISPEMIRRAESTAKKMEVSNVRFVLSELENIDIPSSSANLVISNCTINHAGDKQAVWNEVYRILKPGGRFVVSDIYATRPVPEQYRNDPAAVAECWAGAITRREYFETLIAAGLNQLEIREESTPYPKGSIEVVSITIAGRKPTKCSCCQS